MKIYRCVVFFVIFSSSFYSINLFSQTVDAAVFARNHSYLFLGDQYYRYTTDSEGQETLDDGYPRQMPGGWKRLPDRFEAKVDAALYFPPNAKTYLFSGDEYVRLTGTIVDSGYPRKLPGGWKGLTGSFLEGIDAAVHYEGHTYFYKGNQYVRFTGTQMDADYPQSLAGIPAPFDSGIDAAFFSSGSSGVRFFHHNEYARFDGPNLMSGYPVPTPTAWPGIVVGDAIHTTDPVVPGIAAACGAMPKLGGECWTTEDLLDPKIDHHAQNVMMGMLSGSNPEAQGAAASILCAVKSEQLGGVYISNQAVPAQRAQSAGDAWWTMITPDSAKASCYRKPQNSPPLIVFKEGIRADRKQLSQWLNTAWSGCAISDTSTVCYRETITRPQKGDLIVKAVSGGFEKGLSGFPVKVSSDYGIEKNGVTNDAGYAAFSDLRPDTYTVTIDGCSESFGKGVKSVEVGSSKVQVDVPIPAGTKCEKPVPKKPDVKEACESVNLCDINLTNACAHKPGGRCIAVPGKVCGKCSNAAYKTCEDNARRVAIRNAKYCGVDEKKDAKGCIPQMIKCGIKRNPAGCLKCVSGSPSRAKNACLKRAAKDLSADIMLCEKPVTNK